MDLSILYPYQLNNAKRMVELGSAMDLSSTGVGKSVVSFAVMHLIGAKTILVICPKSVQVQYANKFGEFMSEVRVFYPRQSDKTARQEAFNQFIECKSIPKAFIVTYEQARLMPELRNYQWGICWTDENHRIGNAMTKTYKAINSIRSDHRFGSTATPLRSSPLQAYGIFNWIKPGCLGKNFWHFKARYEVTNDKGWGLGYKNLDELSLRIKPYYVKTTMEEAGVYMPPLVEEDIIFPLSTKEQKLYDNIKKEMILEIDRILINKIENPTNLYLSVVKLGKLQELTDSMELLGQGLESSKIEALKDSLKDHLVDGNKAVIFSRFSRMSTILARELAEYNPAVITGATIDRQAEINKLDNDDSCKVIIGTQAMSEGINLQEKANLLYMIDVPLGSYGTLLQVQGRINRIGQTKPMICYYMMAQNTVDIKLKKLLLKKQEMSERIFGSLAEVKEILE